MTHLSNRTPPTETRGVIQRLTFLSSGTDIASTHLIPAHNGTGYGYIRAAMGDVFFDASAIMNLRFDQLKRNMTVDFVLDQAPYLRTSRVSVVADGRDDIGETRGRP